VTGPEILLIGYGNPARGDDGLGPELARAVASELPERVTAITPYQLMVEHALLIAEVKQVVLADASLDASPPFAFEPLMPRPDSGLDSHGLSPRGLLTLATDLYRATTPCHLLRIRGYEFAPFTEGLSQAAGRNLAAAVRFLVRHLTLAAE